MTLLHDPLPRLTPAAARLRDRLRSRIARRFQTVTREVSLHGLRFSFTRIADPDRVLDEVAHEADRRERLTGRREADEHLHLPYWAELWDSAWGLAQELVGMWGGGEVGRWESAEQPPPCASLQPDTPASLHPTSPPPSPLSSALPSVLDLGCGMGLAGTVAAALGARVLFADLEQPALLFAALNSLPWKDRVRARRLNWREDRLGERFDLIIGADILYERAQWEHLDAFWRAHLAPGGTVLLGEPGRQTGDLFVEWIAARPWLMRRAEQPVPTRPKPIRILQLTPHGA